LSDKTETQVLEHYLIWRWESTEGKGLGPAPNGPGSIARLRLVVMAQGSTQQVLNAFLGLPHEDASVLEEELARTGCEGQEFSTERKKKPTVSRNRFVTAPVNHTDGLSCQEQQDAAQRKVDSGGPALLVYYAPALMQKAGKVDPLGALTILADLFRQARSLFPLVPGQANETAIIRIDALKDLLVEAMREQTSPGEVWVLQKVSSRDAQVRKVNLVKHRKDDFSWSTSRVLFMALPTPFHGFNHAQKGMPWNPSADQLPPYQVNRPQRRRETSSAWPSPAHDRVCGGFWQNTLDEDAEKEGDPPIAISRRTQRRRSQ